MEGDFDDLVGDEATPWWANDLLNQIASTRSVYEAFHIGKDIELTELLLGDQKSRDEWAENDAAPEWLRAVLLEHSQCLSILGRRAPSGRSPADSDASGVADLRARR